MGNKKSKASKPTKKPNEKPVKLNMTFDAAIDLALKTNKNKERLTPEQLDANYKKFIKGKELNPDGLEQFEKAIEKATKPIELKPYKAYSPDEYIDLSNLISKAAESNRKYEHEEEWIFLKDAAAKINEMIKANEHGHS